MRDRKAASNFRTLPRMALNARNLAVAGEKKRKSLPKRELRAAQDEPYLEKLTLPGVGSPVLSDFEN